MLHRPTLRGGLLSQAAASMNRSLASYHNWNIAYLTAEHAETAEARSTCSAICDLCGESAFIRNWH
jgi:hypothetical protein